MATFETRTTSTGLKRYRGKYLDDNGGKHPGPWGPSKKNALNWARDEEAKLRAGTWHDDHRGMVTLDAYFQEWLPLRNYEITTRKYYKSVFNASMRNPTGVQMALGEVQLRHLQQPLIQRWVQAQVAEGITPGTIKARFKVLQTVLACKKGVSALRDKKIAENPCLGVDLPDVDEKEVVVYQVEEADTLCAALGPWWSSLPLLAGETGLRWGELMGLTVADFTDDFTRVYVHHTIIEVAKADTGNGTPWMFKPRPKGKRKRTMAIGPDGAALVKGLIRSRRLFAPTDRLFSPPSGKEDGLPLRTEEWPQGRPVYRGTFGDMWARAHAEAGIEQGERVFHSLRGSHLSWLLAGGADLAVVQERADHRDIETTQRYLTALQDADTRALDALATTKKRYRHG